MQEFDTAKIRNVVLLSHSGAGKTSVAEAILFKAGAISKMGKVEEGSTTGDYHPDEIQRKTTINSAVMNCVWKDHKINIMDTPGYADFVGEVISMLAAADGAILLMDALSGIQLGTERIWKLLEQKNLPRLILINKMDKENVDFFKVWESISNRFGKGCAILSFPDGQGPSFKGCANMVSRENLSALGDEEKARMERCIEQLVEAAAEADDRLLEKYLENGELAPGEVQEGLKKGVKNGKLIPVLCGSATGNLAMDTLLDAIVEYLPSPCDRPPKKGKNPDADREEIRKPDPEEPFSAQAFKTVIDPYVGQLTIFKVFSGALLPETGFYNATKKTRERFSKIYELQGSSQAPKAKAVPGDIVAVAKLKDTGTGDSLCDEKKPILFDAIQFPEPAISFSVKPKSRGDEDKISASLSKLGAEDMTFKVGREQQTKELIISGLGDLHLNVMIERLKSRFEVDVDIGTPKVAYKETVTAMGDAQYRHKKQTGGAGQFAEVWMRVEPMSRGEGFEFVDEIKGGAIPAPFLISCEKGIKTAMESGPLAGYPVVDVKAVVYDGKTHPVDSKDIAFQIAARQGFKEAFLKARPVLLEPIMEVEVTVPDEFMGDITGILNSKRGRILGVEAGVGLQTVKANVPLAEMFKFISELKSLTGGRGSYTMRFSYYEEVPQKIAQTIIAKAKEAKQEG